MFRSCVHVFIVHIVKALYSDKVYKDILVAMPKKYKFTKNKKDKNNIKKHILGKEK